MTEETPFLNCHVHGRRSGGRGQTGPRIRSTDLETLETEIANENARRFHGDCNETQTTMRGVREQPAAAALAAGEMDMDKMSAVDER